MEKELVSAFIFVIGLIVLGTPHPETPQSVRVIGVATMVIGAILFWFSN